MKNLWLKTFSAILIVMLAVVTLPAKSVYASALTVTTNADTIAADGACSLREAIINANNDLNTHTDCTGVGGYGNDTITFSAAVTTITLTSALPAINDAAGANDLTINGGSTVTINANAVARVFNVTAGTFTVQNITLSNGQVNGNGGGILYAGGEGLVVSAVTFNTNRTVMGGGNDGGAIYHTAGTLSITNSTFSGNYTQDTGGAVHIQAGTGTMTISGSTFSNQNNAAINDGGAIYLNAGTLQIDGTTFSGNIATGPGGGASGGAIYQNGGTLTIGNTTASTFTSNSATNDGGAIYVAGGTLTVNDTTFTSNSADQGGAIYHNSNTAFTISSSTFTTNSATAGDGGAVFTNSAGAAASLSITNSAFTGNTSTDDGGALVIVSEPATITGSVFQNNSITSSAGNAAEGGAIRNEGAADQTTIRMTSFINNSVTHTGNQNVSGGAIANNGDNFILANVTFSGNSVNKTAAGGGNAQGGAVWIDGSATIHNVTFSGNSASESGTGTADGGNLYRAGGTVTVRNTILNNGTQNGSADNCGGTLGAAALNSNFADNISFSATDCGASVTNSNPLLGALTGSPAYFPISASSPARNNGINAICATAATTNNQSQNGLTRPQETTCDIGSYEHPPNTPPTGTDNTITINEDASHTFATANFGFNDADAGDTMSAVRVDTLSLPVGATLQLSSVDVTAGQVILTANIPNLVFTPAANANGTGYASFTFSVRDTFGPAFDTTPNTMTFNVTAVNDQPSFTASNPPAVNEDSGIQVVLWAVPDFGPPDEDSSQAVVQYIVSNSTCGTLLSAGPSVNPSGQLTYTPAADQNGTCTFDVQVQDDGGTANGGVDTSVAQNFTITVNAVNDEPSFTASNPPAVNEDAGAQTLVGWVTAFNPGPANESGQAVSQYIISNSTCGTLLSAGPSVNTAGTLTYTPATDQNGTCTFDVQVQDNGGTANGGDDTSPAQNFTITVNAVDDASTANDDIATVWEDSSANTINVRLNDTDIDSGVELIQSVTQPANGTVVITNAGADLTYQPNADYCNDGTPTDNFTYTLTGGNSATVQVTVTCQTVITANITASDKTYDGNTSASFTCSLTGVIPPDVVTCTGGTATFADKNVGTGKLVTATGLGITGADAFKYELASTSATDNADITQRTLNVTATGINKVYDGNTNATVTLNDDRVGGDDLTLSYTSASFADPNVGATKPVSVSGISISGGADAGNYVLGNTTTSTNADITPASQTITVTTNAPASAVNGASFNVAATASSGLPVTITTSGSCTGGDTDGDATITMTSGTGTCSVFYNQAGNSNYNAAPQVQEDVTATDSPVFTSANNTTFDFGFSNTFAITATGNPSTMTITMTGAPAGVSLTDNGDGTATLNYDGTTAPGVYTINFVANNGVLPNGTQTFTLTIRNGPTVSVVNSLPDTGNGSVSENESISTTLNLTQLIVEFNRDVYDPSGDTDPDDVTNPANYLLVRSTSGTFATATCNGGVTAPDVAISVDSVTYSNGGGSGPFVATLNINSGLPLNVAGFYRLYVCGTTSIVDAINPLLVLAGNGVNPGTDFIRNFRIAAPVVAPPPSSTSATTATRPNLTGLLIPVTGFTPNQATTLPVQPVEKTYAKSELALKIPSLGVNLPIVGVKLEENGWDVTWLGNNAGYLEGSAYPTFNGNSVVTGHLTDANGKSGAFAYINELRDGDKVYIHNNGLVYVYEVRQSQLLLPSSIKTLFKSEEDAWLTLVTCETFNEKTNTFKYRRMIRAVLISIIPEK